MIKLLIAEDHPVVRQGLATRLNAEPDIAVIAEAADGQEVIELLQTGICPDVVITDLKMPNVDGITLTQHLAESFPEVKVIILTMRVEKAFNEKARRAGARGYVIKLEVNESPEAIRRVYEGGTYFK